MPPRKQLAHLEEARKLAHPDETTRLNAEQFTFSVIVEGLNFRAIERCMLWNNIIPPSAHMFYEVQAAMIPILISLARKSCDKWRASMAPGSIIALDGSWSHRRNAARCMVDFIDAERKKVVDVEFVEKTCCRVKGNYDGPSNGMEREALRRMIPRWRDDCRVIGYCHDNDGKTRKTMAELGWHITEYLDRNHLMGSFDRAYNKFEKRRFLWGLKEKLRHWMLLLLCEDMTLERKKFYWETVTAEHFAGNHEHCPQHSQVSAWRYGGDAMHMAALKEFLCATSHYLDKCGRLISTQMNESLHALKAHYASKMFCWGQSWTARACVAILQVNEPDNWKLQLYEQLQLPALSSEAVERLTSTIHSQALLNEMRRRPEFRARENARRRRKRTSNKRRESRCNDYGHHAVVPNAAEDRDRDRDDMFEDDDADESAIEEACAEVVQMTPEEDSDDEYHPEEHTDRLCCVA